MNKNSPVNSEKTMILQENIWRVMYRLSWPAIIAMILYGLNTVFDAIFVGQFTGETALAGVSLAYPLAQITLGLGSLIGVGAGSALSIALGADDKPTQEKLLANVSFLSLVIGVAYGIAAFIFAEPLVRFMGGEGQMLVFGTQYFKITAIGAIFWIYGLATNMVIRAEGKMKSAAMIMGIGLAVNLIASYIMVGLLDMGVVGAAWGTNIGMLVYCLLGVWYYSSQRASFPANPFSIAKDRPIVRSIMSMGIPSLIMTVMFLIQSVVVFNSLSNYGTASDVAFYGAVFRIFNLMLTPIFGLMRALQPAVGINYGNNNIERVIKSVKVFGLSGFIILLPFWLVLMIWPEAALATMLPDSALAAADLLNFRVFMSILPALPIIFMAMTFYPAINNGKVASIMGIARQLIFYIPIMLILPRFFGIQWVYFGSTLIDLTITVAVVLYFSYTFKSLRSNKVAVANAMPDSA